MRLVLALVGSTSGRILANGSLLCSSKVSGHLASLVILPLRHLRNSADACDACDASQQRTAGAAGRVESWWIVLDGNFTIDEMLKQKPYPIRGVCESRCFWQAVVTNSCFYPDAIIDIHAPADPTTGKLNRLAADILISETKSPGVQRYLKDSGAAYRVSFTRLTGQDLINMGAPACR